jgi:hypothetical protein
MSTEVNKMHRLSLHHLAPDLAPSGCQVLLRFGLRLLLARDSSSADSRSCHLMTPRQAPRDLKCGNSNACGCPVHIPASHRPDILGITQPSGFHTQQVACVHLQPLSPRIPFFIQSPFVETALMSSIITLSTRLSIVCLMSGI